MKILSLCLFVSLSACASSNLGRKLNVSVVLAASADVLSTEYAKAQGGREANPVIGASVWRHVAIKAGAVSAVLLGSQALASSHQTWSQIIKVIPVIVWSSAAVWNVTRTR